jgi:hypothetical protein
MLGSIMMLGATFAGCAVPVDAGAPTPVVGTTTADPSPRHRDLQPMSAWRPA